MADWRIRTGAELMATGVLFIAAGCTRQVYVPVERYVRDTVRELRVKIDSVRERDSIHIALRGDTIIKEVYRWCSRTRVRTDTVYKTRVDSMPVVIAPKAGKATKEKKIARAIRYGTRGLMVLTVVILIWRYYRRKKVQNHER